MDQSSERARFNMIQQQIRPWDVLDEQVLGVMGEVAREPFVPAAYQGLAYADIEIPLGEGGFQGPGRAMLAPKLVGRMLQALGIGPGDRVLLVGCGSGYEAACLAALGGRVVATEADGALAAGARGRLAGVAAVEVLDHDGLAAPTRGAPFDGIVVNGSVPDDEYLEILLGQLAPGGRLFAVVGRGVVMEARLITRVGPRDLRDEALFETSAPPLPAAPAPEPFVF